MKIFWTQKALNQHADLEAYLLDNWSQSSLEKYLDKLKTKIQLLSQFPNIGMSITSNYRKLNITHHSELIYTLVGDELLIIMMVWDNRKKPIW